MTHAQTSVTHGHSVQREPMIWLKDVEKRYSVGGEEVIALKGITCTIQAGEFVSIIGPSGAGKSTLIRLLIREERPSHGRIIIAGRDIAPLKARELPFFRRRIGVVFQDFRLLPHMTVKENIAFALEVSEATDDEIRNRIPKILDLVSLVDKAEAYPHQLSGGEKQRVSIARALIHSPKILIADEPTGNLDPTNTKDVVELLKRINAAGTLVILASHNKTVVDQLKRRVIVMKDGEIVSDVKEGVYNQIIKEFHEFC